MIQAPSQNTRIKVLEDLEESKETANEKDDKEQVSERTPFWA
jgi:hypothetical protein